MAWIKPCTFNHPLLCRKVSKELTVEETRLTQSKWNFVITVIYATHMCVLGTYRNSVRYPVRSTLKSVWISGSASFQLQTKQYVHDLPTECGWKILLTGTEEIKTHPWMGNSVRKTSEAIRLLLIFPILLLCIIGGNYPCVMIS